MDVCDGKCLSGGAVGAVQAVLSGLKTLVVCELGVFMFGAFGVNVVKYCDWGFRLAV